jgi:hypothetical protein
VHLLRSASRAAALATLGLACAPPPVEEVDTLSYFLSDHPDSALLGEAADAHDPDARGHPLSLSVDGREAYYVKWHANAYERFTWDGEHIYLKEDHTWTDAADGRVKPHAFLPGVWMKRRMRVGEQVDMGGNQMQLLYRGDCRPGRRARLGYQTVLEARRPRFEAGGDLGVQDVIVLRYDYSWRTRLADRAGVNAYEKFYYSREWGWIQWELYRDADRHADPPPLVRRMRFNRRAPAPLRPNLANTCNRARFVGMELEGRPAPPALTLRPGERRHLTLTFENVGGSTWRATSDVHFRLGLVGDAPGEAHRVDLSPAEEVPPGGTKAFRVPVSAPARDQVLRWRMLVEGAEWFGDPSPELQVSAEGKPPRPSAPLPREPGS